MQAIILELKEHKGEERIFVEFPYRKKINDAVRQTWGIKWSQSNRQWHLLAEKKSVEALKQKINSFAKLDTLHVTNKDMLNILSPLEDIKDFL
jgi:hypothetical protein